MQPSQILAVFSLCVILLSTVRQSQSFAITRDDVSDPDITIAVLEELIEALREKNQGSTTNISKRRFDGGYGNRYNVAQRLGSKLMAMKTAADWNNPGRKKRETPMH